MLDFSDRDRWQNTFVRFLDEPRASGIRLRVLVNSIGGIRGNCFAFSRMSERDPIVMAKTIKTIDEKATFPSALTHALLPQLL